MILVKAQPALLDYFKKINCCWWLVLRIRARATVAARETPECCAMMRGNRLLLVAMALAMAVAPLAAASNPDFSDSFRHWKADAERGQAGAQNLMGQAYWRGRGTYPDYARAYFWFSLAAAQGDPSAAASRDRLEKQMTPAELHQARRLIGEWRARSR